MSEWYVKDSTAESRTVQSGLGNVSHCMFNRPNNTIHEELELLRKKAKQR